MSEAVITHLISQRNAILERVKALLRMPSISTDPQFGAGMRDAREFLLGRLRDLGLKNVQAMDGGASRSRAVIDKRRRAPFAVGS